MRKLLLSTLLLIAVSFGMTGCNQNNTTVNPNTNNNNNTTPTTYFKAKVNGTELTWHDATMQLQGGDFFYLSAYSGSGSTVKAIILTIDNFAAAGTFSVTDSTDGNALFGYDQSGNEGGGEGEIKVTSFGAVGGVVIGTFHFKTENYEITDGQFSVTRFM